MRTAALRIRKRTAALRGLLRIAGLALIASVFALAFAPAARAEAPPPAPPPVTTPILTPEPKAELRPILHDETAVQLFATAEEAWAGGDAEMLAALVDTTRVRIGLKPGSAPTAAMTRSAAVFLFQDQLRLVTTQSFQILRINVGSNSAAATARWLGNWGGREGVRRLTVTLSAAPVGGRWCLREVRVKS